MLENCFAKLLIIVVQANNKNKNIYECCKQYLIINCCNHETI